VAVRSLEQHQRLPVQLCLPLRVRAGDVTDQDARSTSGTQGTNMARRPSSVAVMNCPTGSSSFSVRAASSSVVNGRGCTPQWALADGESADPTGTQAFRVLLREAALRSVLGPGARPSGYPLAHSAAGCTRVVVARVRGERRGHQGRSAASWVNTAGAPPSAWSDRRSVCPHMAQAAAGVLHAFPVLAPRATAARSSAVQRERSVPLGKY
jgi:hypothetical protein